KLPYYAQFWFDVEEALEQGTFIPLERLVSEEWLAPDATNREVQIRYGEAYELCRYMDSPDGGPRREKFRAFLKEIEGFAPGNDYAARVNARFRDIFGVRTKGDQVALLAPLERDWVGWCQKKKPYPWHVIGRELRVRPDGALDIES